jgi:hypothetical protein
MGAFLMERSSARFVGAVACLAAAAASIAGVGPAAATPGARQQVAAPSVDISPVGTYTAALPAEKKTSALTISVGPESPSAGTFAFTTLGDYGNWVVSANTITMLVTASSAAHLGNVLVATVAAGGLKGVYSRLGTKPAKWSATRTAKSQALGAVAGSTAAEPAATPPAAGVYTVQFPDAALHDTLTITNDTSSAKQGTFTFTNLGDSGTWVVLGKHLALGITAGGDAGVTLAGALNAVGISTLRKPGLYDRPTLGVYRWYATK